MTGSTSRGETTQMIGGASPPAMLHYFTSRFPQQWTGFRVAEPAGLDRG